MKTFRTTLCVAALAFAVSAPLWAQATLPHHEPFNYTVGVALGAQPNWAGLNSGDTLYIAAGNLSYPGFAASTGNKIALDGAGQEGVLSFTLTATGTVYYSYLLKVTAVGGLTADGGYFTTFYQSQTSTTGGSCVWTRLNGTSFDLGISARITSPVSWSSIKALDSTYLIVASYQFVDGTTNDVCNMWINPDPATFGAATPPTATLTSTNNTTDLTGVARVQIRQDAVEKTPFIQMDEIRIGTTWASVTPPAGATAVDDPAEGFAPRAFVLLPNYPNPFNPTTTITFTVPADGRALLRVFNVLGQEVATVFDAEALAGTYHTASFDATGLPSGMYFSRLGQNGSVQVRSMVLMK